MPDSLESVAIVAMGASAASYVAHVAATGDRRRVAQETWTVNSMAACIQHDRAFVMDDFEKFLNPNAKATPDGMCGGLMSWLHEHPGPVYTSNVCTGYPGAVEYPLEDVVNCIGLPYLNTTVAYAVAFALFMEAKSIALYGCDFTYPDRHISESGRACVEFLLAQAAGKGVHIVIPSDSTLMDANVPKESKWYGYGGSVSVEHIDGKFKVIRKQPEKKEGLISCPTSNGKKSPSPRRRSARVPTTPRLSLAESPV